MAYGRLDRGAAATVRAGDNMSKSSSALFHAALAAWTSARFSSDLLLEQCLLLIPLVQCHWTFAIELRGSNLERLHAG